MPDRSSPPPFVYSNHIGLLPARALGDTGNPLYVVSGGTQDVVRVEWIYPAGRWFEPSPGIAHFASALVNKGTSGRSARELAEAMDSRGAHLELHAGSDYASVSLATLSRFLPDTLSIVHEMLTDSVFPEEELRLARENFIQSRRINLEKTSYLASVALRQVLFGPDHPYGCELDEREATAVTSAALRQFHNTNYGPILTIASGRVDEEAAKLIQSIHGRLPQGHPSTSHIQRSNGTATRHIDKAGSVQSSIRLGKIGLNRRHADYAEFTLLLHLLGGYFGSRLMKNIREEKGLTYGIYATLHPHQHASQLTIGADVNRENLTLAMDEIRKEIGRLRTEPIGKAELEAGRNHLIGSLQSELTTPFAHADRNRVLLLNSLPPDYFQQMAYTMERTSQDRLMELAEAHLNEDSLAAVTAG